MAAAKQPSQNMKISKDTSNLMNENTDVAESKAKISYDTSNLMSENDFDEKPGISKQKSEVKIWDQKVLN